LQDFIFHQLIQKNNFDGWKTEWKSVVRDIKPFWLYKKSEQVLRKKGIFLDEYTERLAKIKNKHQNLFGNINIDNKFMTTQFNKDKRELSLEQLVDEDLEKHFDEETENIGKLRPLFE
jgi:hypothetical protein